MTAPLSAERVEELRGALERWHGRLWNIHKWDNIDEWDRSGLSDILDDYSAMRAEIERLKEDVGRLGVQNEMLKGPWSKIKIVGGRGSWKDKYFNAADLCQFLREDNDRKKAQLEKQRPLIEAVMEAELYGNMAMGLGFLMGEDEKVLREALKLRGGEGK